MSHSAHVCVLCGQSASCVLQASRPCRAFGVSVREAFAHDQKKPTSLSSAVYQERMLAKTHTPQGCDTTSTTHVVDSTDEADRETETPCTHAQMMPGRQHSDYQAHTTHAKLGAPTNVTGCRRCDARGSPQRLCCHLAGRAILLKLRPAITSLPCRAGGAPPPLTQPPQPDRLFARNL